MAVQTVFRRYELKYLLTQAQKEGVLEAIGPYMQPDPYGKTTIRNLYYDTPSYLLIRRSLEKPVYKEKLRLRSYSRAQADTPVFVELKKKYADVVYKRRVALPWDEAAAWLSGGPPPLQTQIAREIGYFLEFYGALRPRVFLSYEREAFYAGDLRVTFDENILCRQDRLSLQEEVGGAPLLPEGQTLMEIKCGGGIPLWLVRTLSRERIYKTSFSKYGTAYKTRIFPLIHPVNPYQMPEVKNNA